jgi:hypothetical protein
MLESLKIYLDAVFDDDVADAKLEGAIERGKKVIDSFAGAEQDYEEEGLPRQLLFDYCRYVRSQAEEMFEINFRHELIALREMTEVQRYADQDDSTVSDVQ